MADKKISQLTALSAANVASATDVLAIVDTSATETKKITAKDLIDGALNGGTANGVLYLNGSKVATSGSAFVFDGTNVGIGTASPDANFKLDVQAATGRVKLTSTTGTNSVVYQANNTGGTLNVGIDSSTGGSLFGVGAYAAGVWYSGNYPLVFGVNNAEGFRLTSSTLYTASGINVGIGTSSPTYKLDVQSATSVIQNKSTTGTNASYYIANNTGGDFYIGRDNSTGATFGTNTGYTSVLWSAGLYPMTFHTNGIERLRISDTGNLGLGVSPSAWSSGGNITLADNKTIGAAGQYLNLSANWYYSGGEKYVGNGYATLYYQQAGAHKWYIAPNNTSGAGATLAWTTAMTLDASGDLLVGTSSSSGRLTVVTGAGSQAALFQSGSGTTQQTIATFSNVTNSGYLSIAGVGTSSSVGTWTNGSMVIEAVPNSTGNLFIGAYTGDLVFQNGRNNSGRFTSGGDLCVKKTTADATTEGAALQANGRGIFTSNSATECILANRQDSDGTLVDFRQANTTEGSISVSGNTVSYNAFAGSHWSQLQDGSKPDILRGTVMESINELCVWPGENNERLPKSKISDTAGSKKVYGVFMAWDNDWTTTNDMYVTAVGAFICRVNGSVTVQEGDLLESNGDGTARVQADDIIRSSTIGKVTSTVKTHEYDDGSYCVPTVLYCG